MTLQDVMDKVEAICTALVILGIPSIVNGLLAHAPKSIQTVGGWLLEQVSMLARKDSPQTLKLPFTVSKPPTPTAATDLLVVAVPK